MLLSLASCTENSRVRTFGGTGTIDLPAGEKLVNVTWKDNDLWYVTRTMSDKDSVQTYRFTESSNLGLAEGTYILIEHK